MEKSSTALTRKIEKQRQAAPSELPKARLCAAVVLSVFDDESDFDLAVSKLKVDQGNNWSFITAFQYMSGRQAKLAAECGHVDEQEKMLLAHRLAESICNDIAFQKMSFSALKAIATSANLGITQS